VIRRSGDPAIRRSLPEEEEEEEEEEERGSGAPRRADGVRPTRRRGQIVEPRW
jgi:hypothetical protein